MRRPKIGRGPVGSAHPGTTSSQRQDQTKADVPLAKVVFDNRGGRARLTVIITAFNASETIAETLESLWLQEGIDDWDLVVLDDASTDDTLAVVLHEVAEHAASAAVIAMQANVGAARGRSVARAFVDTPFIGFFDADDAANVGYIAAHLRTLDAADGDAVSFAIIQTAYFDDVPTAFAQFDTGQSAGAGSVFGCIPFAGGGTVAMPVAVFDRLAGVDPVMFGCEDIDFSVRLWLARIPLVHADGAVCFYRQRSSAGALFRQKRAYARAHVRLVKKYWPIVNRKRYAYWQLRGIARLPKQLTLAGVSWLRGGDQRLVGLERVAGIVGYFSGSLEHRVFVLCPWGRMLNPLDDPSQLDSF